MAQIIHDEIIMRANDLQYMQTFIDLSHAARDDMERYVRGIITFGTGVARMRTGKHKINSRSSTKTESIGIGEFLLLNVWQNNFMEVQGYRTQENKLWQANEGAQRIAKNYKML